MGFSRKEMVCSSQSASPGVEHFNEWKPKGHMYLDCPFDAKDRAKKMGAKWDGECNLFPKQN